MAGTRGESWWQPPKQFDEPAAHDPDDGLTWDDVRVEQSPAKPARPARGGEGEVELDEVELEDHNGSPVGWSMPTGSLVTRDSTNRRFYAGIALIVVATTVGVLFALTLGSSDDDGDALEAATTIPLDVQGATTLRPGGMSPLCEAEKTRVREAEEAYRNGSIHGQFTDMEGLVNSGKLAAPSTLFVVNNEMPGDPATVSFAGISAREFEDYLILPIPDGPCDTT